MSRRRVLLACLLGAGVAFTTGCRHHRPFLRLANAGCWPHCYGPGGVSGCAAPGPVMGEAMAVDPAGGNCSSCFSPPVGGAAPVGYPPGPGYPVAGAPSYPGQPIFPGGPSTPLPTPQVIKDPPSPMPPMGGTK